MDDDTNHGKSFGGWYRSRIGRRIEVGVNRLIGAVLMAIGACGFFVSFGSETFSLYTHWPGIALSAGLFALAYRCFIARESIIDFGDECDSPRRRD